MQNSCLISIIMPVYNTEKYLDHALDSLRGQSYTDIEIICIDDGSTDTSLKILEEHAAKDHRVRVFSQKNSGPASARNKGLKEAQGQYIMFCDSDDTYTPDMCKKMMEAMLREDVDLVRCNANVTYEENVARMTSPLYGSNLTRVGKHEAKSIIRKRPSVMLWHQLFKKSIIEKYNISFPDGLESDDALFCYEYYSVCGTIFGLKDKLYNYKIRYNSIMDRYFKRKTPSLYDQIKIFEHFYAFLKRNQLEGKKNFLYLFAHRFVKCWETCNNDEEKQIAVDLTKKILAQSGYKPVRKSILDLIQQGASLEKIDNYLNTHINSAKYFGSPSILKKIAILFTSFKKYNEYYRI